MVALAAIVSLGATLRFATLGKRSLWEDEATTVLLMRLDFGDMLAELPESEGSPPLFYLLTWPWAQLSGEGEAALRVLPALWGVLTIPVVYLAAREVLDHRAGLAAALLAAVSPQLIWHAQDVRAYSLYLLLAALSFLLFLRARAEPSARRVGWWAAVSALALATHWFAAFLVVVEAAALLRSTAGRARRRVIAGSAVAGAALLALLPLAVAQSDHGGRFLEGSALTTRLGQLVVEPVVGYQPPAQLLVVALGGGIGVAGLVAGWRSLDAERRGRLAVPAAVGAAVVVLPLLLLALGRDYVHTPYFLGAWPALAVVAAVALGGRGAGRAGPVVLGLYAVLAVVVVVVTADRSKFEHQDWRTAYRLLGPVGDTPRAVVVPTRGIEPLEVYRDEAERSRLREPERVREVAVVLLPSGRRELGKESRPARGPVPAPPGFEPLERREAPEVTFVRFRSPEPTPVDPAALRALAGDLADEYAVVLEAPRP